MKKKKASIITSLEFLGTSLNFADIIYRTVPAVEGTLPFLRIDKVNNLVRVLKTEGFLGDFGDNHRFDFAIYRPEDWNAPNEIRTATGEVLKVTKYNRLHVNTWCYSLEAMTDGNIRLTHSKDFLEGWEHLDITGYLFKRTVVE